MRTDDDGLRELIVPNSEKTLCGGFRFTEGPIWVPDSNYLLFSDIPTTGSTAGHLVHPARAYSGNRVTTATD